MKGNHFNGEAASAGGAASGIPFHDAVAARQYAAEAVAAIFSSVFNAIEGRLEAINRWRWERTTRRTLASLSNRTLADIGIARSEIMAIARAAARNRTFAPVRRRPWSV